MLWSRGAFARTFVITLFFLYRIISEISKRLLMPDIRYSCFAWLSIRGGMDISEAKHSLLEFLFIYVVVSLSRGALVPQRRFS